MTTTVSSHIGRSWTGMGDPLERNCPCPKAPCGLVIEDQADPGCEQHPSAQAQTMRQRHTSANCPAQTTDPVADAPPTDQQLAAIRAKVVGRALCDPDEAVSSEHVWGPGQFSSWEICVICHVTRDWAEEETDEKLLLAEVDRLRAELATAQAQLAAVLAIPIPDEDEMELMDPEQYQHADGYGDAIADVRNAIKAAGGSDAH